MLLVLWLTGGYAVKKLVVAVEGSTEFGQGTTSKLRRVKGYATFGGWVPLATLPTSFLAEWGVHGDLDAALRRFGDRAEVAIHILDAMGDDG